MMQTTPDLLAAGRPDAPALLAPGQPPLPYGTLRSTIERVGGQLRASGVARGDRVAIVLPNGPEMAQLFLAACRAAVAAPLNPKYRTDEFRFYLTDLRAKALVTLESDAVEAHAAAPPGVVTLMARPSSDGVTLTAAGGAAVEPARLDGAQASHEALVLHTSGTTSRPKIVPLTHGNLTASARGIAAGLSLTESDRCLNVMPLFHIHGLVAGLLAPLAAGGSVICPPGFDAFKFFEWMDRLQPTWYTAVPTMHQMILARASRYADVIARTPLRFVRSSSASLPPVVLEEIERVFGVPMIEAYGMTEASHQMASNPLPPGARMPGSVGRPTGVEIAIMDDGGRLLPAGERGEVVIRGPAVTAGYESNPEANARAFTNGWFRTGDQGYFDQEGYLFLTGRLKEIINRGGEKISPLEVDAVLLRHPAVAQAVAFGMPHPKLGEEVAVAVVLADGAQATEKELRAFAAQHLAEFKVPRRVVFVPEIPKGPTGKPQRIGLAERLGLT